MRMYQEDTKRNNWSMRRSQEDNSPSEKSVRRFGIIVWRVHQVGRSGRQAITYSSTEQNIGNPQGGFQQKRTIELQAVD